MSYNFSGAVAGALNSTSAGRCTGRGKRATSSRNFSLGVGLGRGTDAATLLADRRTVAEGAFTAPVLARLAREKGIDMPIVAAVDELIAGRSSIDQVLGALLSRPPRPESH